VPVVCFVNGFILHINESRENTTGCTTLKCFETKDEVLCIYEYSLRLTTFLSGLRLRRSDM